MIPKHVDTWNYEHVVRGQSVVVAMLSLVALYLAEAHQPRRTVGVHESHPTLESLLLHGACSGDRRNGSSRSGLISLD